MYKIHSSQNKLLIMFAGSVTAVVILVIVNLVVLVPIVREVFIETQRPKETAPLDTEIVNQAIRLLEQ